MSESVWKRIESSRARHNVLEHPFYVRWSAGELSPDELARYSGQYRHATEALAKLTADTAGLAPDAHRDEIERHAAEEQDHIGLWDDFAASLEAPLDREPAAETRGCADAWARDDRLEALAVLYAIESAQPAISETKLRGLVEHYGFAEGPATEYFALHAKRDIEHAAEAREALEAAAPGDEDGLVAAAETALRANWELLDGVQRAA
ncbi:MAG: iron-containing redox enzyme family protein [Actinomycetota bacterium]|nr:iron-containing redox enzyme family protein [Actinomycetota bacterium]